MIWKIDEDACFASIVVILTPAGYLFAVEGCGLAIILWLILKTGVGFSSYIGV